MATARTTAAPIRAWPAGRSSSTRTPTARVDATTVTGPGGTYSFTGLTAGTYRIREVGQVGWTQTTVNPGDVTVVSGTNSTGNNFGNYKNERHRHRSGQGQHRASRLSKSSNKDTGKILVAVLRLRVPASSAACGSPPAT